ncbi:hypothetical protein [Mesorhizobium sp. 1M-11]|uniref:hypothetical protein n=1 Tax=Mesorhizobium sp. 1M-11 TaxID=1529006 RepID=UPI000AC2073A|nr:hypothetical protein [Mesorhizobium sp. 1M-11]
MTGRQFPIPVAVLHRYRYEIDVDFRPILGRKPEDRAGLLRPATTFVPSHLQQTSFDVVHMFQRSSRNALLRRIAGLVRFLQAKMKIGSNIGHRQPDAGIRIVGKAGKETDNLRLHGFQYPIPCEQLFRQRFEFDPFFGFHLFPPDGPDHSSKSDEGLQRDLKGTACGPP